MKKKKNGFAATGVLYTILVIFLILMSTLLVTLSSRSRILSKLKSDAKNVPEKVVLKDYVQNGLILNYDGHEAPYAEGTNQYWRDLSGNNNQGVLYNFDSTSGWAIDNVRLDGMNDYINLGLKNYNFEKNITFEMLVKINELRHSALFGNWEAAGGGMYINSDFNLYFEIYIEELNMYKNIHSNKTMLADTWYTIVGTYDGTTIKLYINGNLESSLDTAGKIKTSPVNMILGANENADSYSTYSSISIRRASLYNRALTQAEITQNYEIDKQKFNI